MMESLWIFPGQGGQHEGMLNRIDSDLKNHVEELLNLKLKDSAQAYQDSVQLQVGIALLQVDQVRKLAKYNLKPNLVAGHSLGVFAAAYAAGVIKLDDLFRLVKYRATLMQNSYPHGYGMGVIVGLERKYIESLVAKVSSTDMPVYVSNQNATLQTAISGNLSAIREVLSLAKNKGASKAIILKVPVPSHSPLMKNVSQKLQEMLETIELNRPQRVIYLANTTGKPLRQIIRIKQDLSDNVSNPVYFDTMMSVATNYQPQVILNFSPGKPFKKVIGEKFDQISQIYLDQMSIEDAAYLLGKWERKSN
nr:acyltransferase domain-containing protein [Lactobacillus colini]